MRLRTSLRERVGVVLRRSSKRPLLRGSAKARTRGQILVEIVVVVAVIATFGATIATLVVVAQRTQESARRRDIASGLAADALAAVRTIANSDDLTTSSGYNRVYCPPRGAPDTRCPAGEFPVASTKYDSGASALRPFRPLLFGGRWFLDRGQETITIADIAFTRYITIENTCRNYDSVNRVWGDAVGVWYTNPSVECPPLSATAIDDPFTQRLTARLQAQRMRDFVVSRFLTRSRNTSSTQSDWIGGEVSASFGPGQSRVTFTINWSDPDESSPGGERVKAHVCKSDSFDAASQTCTGGSWADSSDFTSDKPIILTYDPVIDDIGVPRDYWVFVCDDEAACSSGSYGTFTVQ